MATLGLSISSAGYIIVSLLYGYFEQRRGDTLVTPPSKISNFYDALTSNCLVYLPMAPPLLGSCSGGIQFGTLSASLLMELQEFSITALPCAPVGLEVHGA